MISYDLRNCWPSFDGQDDLLMEALGECLARSSVASAKVDRHDHERVQLIAAAARCEPRHHVVVTNSGQSALRVALAAICGDGSPIAVEEWTHPGILRALLELGAAPMAIRMDRQGMIPEELAIAAESGIRRVLVQSRIHDPTGTSIDVGRRRAIADVIASHGMLAIENDAFGFLQAADRSGLASLAPEACIRTVGFSEWISRAIGGGLIEFPPRLAARVAERMQSSGAHASGICVAALAELAARGHFATFADAKRREGIARQCLARRVLNLAERVTRTPSWHLWLPAGDGSPGRMDALRAKGIEVSVASLFRLPGGHEPHARVSLGGERDRDRLEAGLAEVAVLLGSDIGTCPIGLPNAAPKPVTDALAQISLRAQV